MNIPEDYLNDLSSRFIINIPEEEKRDPVRLFFQIEQAYWYYLDFHRTENTNLKNCGIKEFSKHMLRHIPSCTHLLRGFDEHYEKWRLYKSSVPTYGAILLNEDLSKVLLVQSFFEKTSWGFPKGKVNEDEAPINCAVREVYEEVGCDISLIAKPNVFLEATVNDQTVRLYIVPSIKETTEFCPQTRMEIKKIQWFNINELPISKKDSCQNIKPNGFFMVIPFVRKLKAWVEKNKTINFLPDISQGNKRQRHQSVGDPTVMTQALTYEYDKTLVSFTKSKAQKNLMKLLNKDHATVVKPAGEWVVPCWLSFKLDYGPILRCFD